MPSPPHPGLVGAVRATAGPRTPTALALTALAATVLALAGCAPGPYPVAVPTPLPAPTPTGTPLAGLPSAASPATGQASSTGTRSGLSDAAAAQRTSDREGDGAPVVVLDPGHNGGNIDHPELIGRLVDAGFGQRKPCNTVGSETVDGYPEHAFTFDVARRARAMLLHRGVRVLLTRADDRRVGPCVDARARFGNAARAAAVVSIHADGALPAGHGFHVIEDVGTPSSRPVAAASHRLALRLRAALRTGLGLDYATYLADGDGLAERTDLAGLNLSTRPAVVVECGNMRNATDAGWMESSAARERLAAALADGVLAFLAER